MGIEDDSDRHNLYLQKLAAGIYNSDVWPALNSARLDVRSLLLNEEELRNITQVRRLTREINRIIEDIYGAGWVDATESLEQTALYEAEWQTNAINQYSAAALAVPADEKVLSYINRSIMTLTSGQTVNYGTWAEFVAGNKRSVAQAYNGLVINGYQNGLTVNQIARDIKATTDTKLAREAETLARTGMAHYANGARDVMASENSDIITKRVFSATFDNRTTLICRSNDGKTWDIDDDNYPRIPLHYGCRSSYYFVTDDSEIGQGRKAAVGGKTDGSDINPRRKLQYRGKRDNDLFNAGQINASTTQDAWLRRQPRWFVETALGKERAKLFLDGNMRIERFTDMQGQTINLDKLKQLDSEAFERAGL